MQVEDTAGGGFSRRDVLLGAAGAAATIAVTGCSSGDAATSASSSAVPVTSASADAPTTPAASDSPVIATTGDVPLGSGAIVSDVLLTQPTPGAFRAFVPKCTHQGCRLTTFVNNAVVCPCHGSAFRLTDGSVINGPAKAPLVTVQITVDGNSIRRAN